MTVESLVTYDSWGRYPVSAPSQVVVLDEQPELPARWEATLLPYGNGCSYGDVCLNNGGTLLVTRAANTLLDADWERGVVRCQAGMTKQRLVTPWLAGTGDARYPACNAWRCTRERCTWQKSSRCRQLWLSYPVFRADALGW